jgi:hypothetical protein
MLRETTSRGLCGLGCPSRTSEHVCVSPLKNSENLGKLGVILFFISFHLPIFGVFWSCRDQYSIQYIVYLSSRV